MTIKSRFAAVLAGAAFALAAVAVPASAQTSAQLQDEINALMARLAAMSGTTATVTFTTDLTIGSTGAQVVALQSWLESKGYLVMPAGVAKGYFGELTRAALARFQVASGISPAVGYFGPITRAKVNAMAGVVVPPVGTGTGTGTGTGSTGGLSGGEADLSDFEFNRENSTGDEGEEGVEIATAEFDVEDGDVRVERFELMASSTGAGSASDRPWDYFDTITLWADGDEIADVDASDRDAWDEEDGDEGDIYRLIFSNLDYVVDAEDRAAITVAADLSDSIDATDVTSGEFDFYVEDEGIRARDGEGIDSYIGDDTETVSFAFGEEENGDLNIESNDEDPDTLTLIADDSESEEYLVFVFDLDNQEDADTIVTDLVIDVVTASSTIDAEDLLASATLMVDGDEYDGDIEATAISFDDIDLEIAGDEAVSFELWVTLRADAAIGGSATISFDVDTADVTAEGAESGDDSDVSGSAGSETHSVSEEGIMVEGVSTDAEVDSNSDTSQAGTFTITFTVEALEEDAYIYNGADNVAASTTGVVYNIYRGGTAVGATTTDSALLQSDAEKTAGFYVVDGGDTEEFTLTVSFDPTAGQGTALYYVELETVYFDDANDGEGGNDSSDTAYSVPDEDEFETSPVSLTAGTNN